MVKYLSVLVLIMSFTIEAFERSGWPGEGVPVISFKEKEILFCDKPVKDEYCKLKPVQVDVEMTLDDFNKKIIEQTLVITKKAVTMKATASFKLGNSEVEKGDVLMKYQYAGEGEYYVGVNGKVSMIDLYTFVDYLDNTDQEPVVEWWVKFVGKGWAEVNTKNFKFHDREF